MTNGDIKVIPNLDIKLKQQFICSMINKTVNIGTILGQSRV